MYQIDKQKSNVNNLIHTWVKTIHTWVKTVIHNFKMNNAKKMHPGNLHDKISVIIFL